VIEIENCHEGGKEEESDLFAGMAALCSTQAKGQ